MFKLSLLFSDKVLFLFLFLLLALHSKRDSQGCDVFLEKRQIETIMNMISQSLSTLSTNKYLVAICNVCIMALPLSLIATFSDVLSIFFGNRGWDATSAIAQLFKSNGNIALSHSIEYLFIDLFIKDMATTKICGDSLWFNDIFNSILSMEFII